MVLTQLPPDLDEVDVIIVGGGTAASVIAARLSDADSDLAVLVIERGQDNKDVSTIVHPALYRTNFDPQKGVVLYHVGGQEEQLANRNMVVPTGGTLGGGSSVNAFIYSRGQSVDYDSWDTEGWSADDLIPFLKKFETYYPPGGGETHGFEGPTAVSAGRYSSATLRDDFVRAANQLGYPSVDDVQDLHSGNAVSPAYRWVSPTTGRRQDAAHIYLHPRDQGGSGTPSGNLHVLVQSQVNRVLFDEDNRASGVEFRNSDGMHTVKARKLVVVSAGTLGSPQILERSGVGNPQVLSKAGVPVVEQLDGVGHQYQDHQMAVVVYNSTLTVEETCDSVVNGAMKLTELLESDSGILSWNGVDVYAKIRPTESDVEGFDSRLRTAWDRDFAQTPERPLAVILPLSGIPADIHRSILGDFSPYPVSNQYMSFGCYSAYPYSRGHVHITGPGLDDSLDFKSGYLSDAEGVDVQIMVWLYKKQRELARRMKIRREQVSPSPRYGEDSAATDKHALGPDASGQDIDYSPADNEAIEQWARENVGTTFHPIGTCPMAPREKMGVVDANLDVHGTKGLKVADLSILPKNVSGNTMSAALLVGEKAADIFIKELGLGK